MIIRVKIVVTVVHCIFGWDRRKLNIIISHLQIGDRNKPFGVRGGEYRSAAVAGGELYSNPLNGISCLVNDFDRVDAPDRRFTTNIAPVGARCRRLAFAVIVAGGGGENGIVGTNGNLAPIIYRTNIVNCGKATAIIERTVVNTRHAIWNCDARKATAT